MARRRLVKRLEQLEQLLRSIKPKRFNIQEWVQFAEDDEHYEEKCLARFNEWKANGGKELPCGTTACAAGWAASHKPFQKLGLHLEVYRNEHTAYPVYNHPIKGRFVQLDAVQEFFGLTYFEATCLFFGNKYPNPDVTPTDVADRIHSLLDGKWGEAKPDEQVYPDDHPNE